MRAGLVELLSIFVIVIGCCVVVGAASFVSTALAVLTAGVFLVFGGVVGIYVASAVEKPEKAKTP